MAQVFKILSYALFALSLVALILTVYFYRKFDIKGLFKDSRSNAKALKNQFSSSKVNSALPLFDGMNRELPKKKPIHKENNFEETAILNSDETTILNETLEETTILSEETTVLNEQTTVLQQSDGDNKDGNFGVKISSTDEVIK